MSAIGSSLATHEMKARSPKRLNVVGRTGEMRGYTALRKEVLLRFQTDYVWRLLIAAKGNVSLAARMAQIDRKQLWRLIRKTGIRIQRETSAIKRR
jgi:DNA-binding NtrC family response regulator